MRFSVKKVEVLIFLIFFVLLSALGVWQLQRATQKRDIESRINARSNAAALMLNKSVDWDPDQIEYQKINVSGEFLPQGQLLIDNILIKGKPGYHVMSALKIDGSEQIILVNRGWTVAGRSREQLPEIALPVGRQTLEGIVRTPSALPFVDASMTTLDMTVPVSLWLYPDLEKYQRETGFNLLPFAMLQNSDNGDGLLRDWPAYQAKVSMHIAYAIQWFAFALIVLIIFIGVGRKHGREAAEH